MALFEYKSNIELTEPTTITSGASLDGFSNVCFFICLLQFLRTHIASAKEIGIVQLRRIIGFTGEKNTPFDSTTHNSCIERFVTHFGCSVAMFCYNSKSRTAYFFSFWSMNSSGDVIETPAQFFSYEELKDALAPRRTNPIISIMCRGSYDTKGQTVTGHYELLNFGFFKGQHFQFNVMNGQQPPPFVHSNFEVRAQAHSRSSSLSPVQTDYLEISKLMMLLETIDTSIHEQLSNFLELFVCGEELSIFFSTNLKSLETILNLMFEQLTKTSSELDHLEGLCNEKRTDLEKISQKIAFIETERQKYINDDDAIISLAISLSNYDQKKQHLEKELKHLESQIANANCTIETLKMFEYRIDVLKSRIGKTHDSFLAIHNIFDVIVEGKKSEVVQIFDLLFDLNCQKKRTQEKLDCVISST